MKKESIQSLKPNVSQSEAMRAFTAFGLGSLYWRSVRGPVQRLAQVYVPFILFRVRYETGRTVNRRLFGIDSVDGSLDMFEFPRNPDNSELLEVETRNSLPSTLTGERAVEIFREKVLRIVFQQGFFKLREPRVDITREASSLHLPYWLAFYGQQRQPVRCRAMDAVRRRMEGGKASAFFETWLAA
jgi:hypothetical protein